MVQERRLAHPGLPTHHHDAALTTRHSRQRRSSTSISVCRPSNGSPGRFVTICADHTVQPAQSVPRLPRGRVAVDYAFS